MTYYPSAIVALMSYAGFSQSDLARALGVSRNTLRRWAIGETSPAAVHLLDALVWLEQRTGRTLELIGTSSGWAVHEVAR